MMKKTSMGRRSCCDIRTFQEPAIRPDSVRTESLHLEIPCPCGSVVPAAPTSMQESQECSSHGGGGHEPCSCRTIVFADDVRPPLADQMDIVVPSRVAAG